MVAPGQKSKSYFFGEKTEGEIMQCAFTKLTVMLKAETR